MRKSITVKIDRFSFVAGLGGQLYELLEPLVVDVMVRPFGHLVSREAKKETDVSESKSVNLPQDAGHGTFCQTSS